MSNRLWILRCVIFVPLLVVMACSGTEELRDSRVELPFLRVDVESSIRGGDSALIVFQFPTPCYHSPKLSTKLAIDTIRWVLTATPPPEDVDCITVVVPDSFYTTIDPGQAGDYLLVYDTYDGPQSHALKITYE